MLGSQQLACLQAGKAQADYSVVPRGAGGAVAEPGTLHHPKCLLAATPVPVPFSGLQMVWLAQLDMLEHRKSLTMHPLILAHEVSIGVPV